MTAVKKIDLHLHTTFSDGTDTPAELLNAVREAGIDLFSVADHDVTMGCELIRPLLGPGDPLFIPGIEFSCKDEGGKYHILGYNYKPQAQAIRMIVERGHLSRIEKTKERLEILRKMNGIEFSPEDIEWLFSKNSPGKPHIANLMVKNGYAGSIGMAFRNYLNHLKVPSVYIRPEEAITAILESGGIPVLAHPSYGSGDEIIVGDEMDQRLQNLTAFGLQGVEAFYSGFTMKLQSEVLKFAEKYGLYVTAGSDYHGANKLVRLGNNHLDDAGSGPEGLKRFIRDVLGQN